MLTDEREGGHGDVSVGTVETLEPHRAVRRSPFAGTSGLAELARRRFQLTAATPRELVVPLLTPVLVKAPPRLREPVEAAELNRVPDPPVAEMPLPSAAGR